MLEDLRRPPKTVQEDLFSEYKKLSHRSGNDVCKSPVASKLMKASTMFWPYSSKSRGDLIRDMLNKVGIWQRHARPQLPKHSGGPPGKVLLGRARVSINPFAQVFHDSCEFGPVKVCAGCCAITHLCNIAGGA
mmetsp:Transcript_35298/g.56807  ORF Transcript_35298/g.56807 Transcript_35298/m.56807 type:complete len:133 (-) Transcript_35298:566-964(-)